MRLPLPNTPLTIDDLFQHSIRIGIDIHPSIELASERTKLGIFYEEVRAACPRLADKVISSDTEFALIKTFSANQGNAKANVPVFVMTGRGPVFRFPLLLPPPIGETELEETWEEDFNTMKQIFARAIPGRIHLRCGLVRELLFVTGQDRCDEFISSVSSFAGADLIGGESIRLFRDDKYNNRIKLETFEIESKQQLAVGTTVREDMGFGLKVELDVNNHDLHALNDDEVAEILERACSLWPDMLLEYLVAVTQ